MHEAEKAALRRRLLDSRRSRPDDEIESARDAIRRHVLSTCAAHGWRTVAAFEPLRTEPASAELLDELLTRGVRVLVPVLLPDRDLDWTEWPRSADPPPLLGIDAIASADAVLVPALAVSRAGARIGRGGGSYDRALSRVASPVPVAALVFGDELLDEVPVDGWDRPVSAAVTPDGWQAVG